MSEYQYYEFRAVDRPLSKQEMGALRAESSRAEITPTSFVNTYNWGDFKGNPDALMKKYFDAFVYVANWGTHQFMLRVPRWALKDTELSAYCAGDSASARETSDFVTFDFRSEDEEGDWEEGEGYMAFLIPLRAELMNGDLRCLYLGWLLCAQCEELDEDDMEPPVPPGLAKLSEPLREFAEHLRIDEDLNEVAAEASLALEAAGLPKKNLQPGSRPCRERRRTLCFWKRQRERTLIFELSCCAPSNKTNRRPQGPQSNLRLGAERSRNFSVRRNPMPMNGSGARLNGRPRPRPSVSGKRPPSGLSTSKRWPAGRRRSGSK
jgi:hypothetical protein